MSIDTVNIILMNNGVIETLFAFPDDYDGNKEVEGIFREKVRDAIAQNEFYEVQNDTIKEDIESYLDDGFYDDDEFGIYVVHSTREMK